MAASNMLALRIKQDYTASGALSVGSKLPTIKQMAIRYNVSCPTIVKAVEYLAEQGWVVKRQGSGIYVAKLGDDEKSLDLGQPAIGCIVKSFKLLFPHRVLEGVEYVARNHNYICAVGNSNGEIKEERRQIENMRKSGVQGIVLYPNRTGDDRDKEYLAKEFLDFPIVVVDLYENTMKRPHVLFDNFEAGRGITRHLLSLGKRNIVFAKYPSPYRSVDDRFAGFRQAMRDAKLPVEAHHVVEFGGGNSEVANKSQLFDVLERVLNLSSKADAIILPSDYHVPQAVKFLETAGIQVPEELLVASFDNLREYHVDAEWLTTSPDFMRMGERAAEILLDRIQSKDLEPSQVVLPCPVIMPNSQLSIENARHRIESVPV